MKKHISLFIFALMFIGALHAGDKRQIAPGKASAPFSVKGDLTGFRESDFASVEKYTYASRGLLVFLDDTEEFIGDAVSGVFYVAFAQAACPIIVSSSIIENVFRLLTREAGLKKCAEQFKAGMFIGEGYTEELCVGEYMRMADNVSRDLAKNSWIIKKIRPELYLFLPHSYLVAHAIPIEEAEKYTVEPMAALTPCELKLGLKVNHMETISSKDKDDTSAHVLAIRKPSPEPDYATYFVSALYDDSTRASAIFCQRTDYVTWREKLPLWSIFLMGHGYLKKRIVGLTLADFQKVLWFFENKINMRLLAYLSCYAAGMNTEIIYRDAKSGIQKVYSFPIITRALTDAPIEATSDLEDYKFSEFIQLTEQTTTEPLNYAKITVSLYGPIFGDHMQNWPQIKLPGIEWFSVQRSNADIASIGTHLALTRDPHKPLDITQFMGSYAIDSKTKKAREPIILTLYAPIIPFEVILDAPSLVAVVSMIPGDAIHVFNKISTSFELERFLELFMNISGSDVEKIIYIELLTSKKKPIAHDIIIMASGDVPYAYYYSSQTPFQPLNIKRAEAQPRLAHSAEIAHYEDLLRKIKKFIADESVSRPDRESIKKLSETIEKKAKRGPVIMPAQALP